MSFKELPPEGEHYLMEGLEADFGEILIMADKGVLPLSCYTVLANRMKLGPVWVSIVAPPSGGKSELLASMFDMTDYIHPLSSLTPNTLISGIKLAGGKSASLLDDIIGKTVIMKDLTTIVEMSKEDRREILSQMREVYDRRFDKAFGTGEQKVWEGHVGWLGAITPEGQEIFGSRGAMGERFLFYRMKMPNRMDVLYRSAQNHANNMELMQLRLKACMNRWLEPMLIAADNMTDDDRKVILDVLTQDRVFKLAEFTTRARSSVRTHWKTGEVEYVHPAEMPTRFANQLTGIAGAALFSYKSLGEVIEGLKKRDMNILADICWGSIPSHRADLVRILSEHKQGTTKAIAAKMGYETSIVRAWMMELAGLKIIKRQGGSSGGDVWYMSDSDRNLVADYSGFVKKDTEVVDDEDDGPMATADDKDVANALAKQADEFKNMDPATGQLTDAIPYDENNPDHPDYY
jgi:hypothetical protein